MTHSKVGNINRILHTTVVLLVIGILSFFFVPTHDDLISLSCLGIKDAFSNALNYGNGRFLGNFMVAVCLNRVVLDSVFRALFIGGIIILSAVLINGYRTSAVWVSFFMYLGIGLPVLRQSFVWGHGFYNYTPPVFWLLFVLWIIKTDYRFHKRNLSGILAVAAFVCAFVAQLFAENSTTINSFILILVLVVLFIQKKELLVSVCAVLGSGLGAACMFLGPTLLGVAHRMDGYREVSSTVFEYISNGARNGFEIVTILSSAWGIWAIVSGLLLMLLGSKKWRANWIFIPVLCVFPVVSIFQSFTGYATYKLPIDCLFAAYLVCAGLCVFKLLAKKELQILALIVGIALLSVAQLLIVSPIGPRCLFVTNAVLILAVLYVFRIVCENKTINMKRFLQSVVVLCCAAYSLMLAVYIQSWNVHCVRMEYAQEQLSAGKTQIEIIELPHPWFFHCPNESYVYAYTFNHGNKDEMEFTYIDYEEYFENKKMK